MRELSVNLCLCKWGNSVSI